MKDVSPDRDVVDADLHVEALLAAVDHVSNLLSRDSQRNSRVDNPRSKFSAQGIERYRRPAKSYPRGGLLRSLAVCAEN
jgi:hypothetical protein